MLTSILITIIVVFGLIILLSGIFTVKQQTAAVLERFGKFRSIRNSGLHFKVPIIDQIAGRINLKVQQLDVLVETKTKDDVFVKIGHIYISTRGDFIPSLFNSKNPGEKNSFSKGEYN